MPTRPGTRTNTHGSRSATGGGVEQNTTGGTVVPTDAKPFPNGDPLAQPNGSGDGARPPYVRSEHAVNWGSRDPFGGAFQYDANGYPIGPGGFRYTGAQHEFSGGVGQNNVGMINGAAPGDPSYAQWIEEVRRIQAQKSQQAASDSMARAEKYGNPAARPGANPAAAAWLNQHPGNGAGGPLPPIVSPNTPPAPPPASPPVPDPFAVPPPSAAPTAPPPAGPPPPVPQNGAGAAPAPAAAAMAPPASPFGAAPTPLRPSQALTTTAGGWNGAQMRPKPAAFPSAGAGTSPVATTQQMGTFAQKQAGTMPRPASPLPVQPMKTRSPFDVGGYR